jgi:6-pyruvoyltetrahydropterin/6-carboxytetrahydropterin synthase
MERILHVTHALRLYDGQEEPMHDHDWRVEVQVSSDDLDEIGVVMDFHELIRHMEGALAPLRGQVLNHLPAFAGKSSSSEAVAAYIFHAIAPQLPRRVRLDEVTIFRDEAIKASFTFRARDGARRADAPAPA